MYSCVVIVLLLFCVCMYDCWMSVVLVLCQCLSRVVFMFTLRCIIVYSVM